MAGLTRTLSRVGVFDTVSQFNKPGEPRRDLPGFAVFHQPGPLKQFLRDHIGKPFRFLYQPKAGSLTEHFEAVNILVKHAGSMIYGVDEVDRHMTASFVPPAFYDLLNYGRHFNVSMILSARRPQQVAREVTAACYEMRLFRMTEKNDRKYFEDLCGTSAANQLATLEQFKYLLWHDDGSEPAIGGGRK